MSVGSVTCNTFGTGCWYDVQMVKRFLMERRGFESLLRSLLHIVGQATLPPASST